MSDPQFCELHVHLEGTLEPELIFELAAKKRLQLPYRDVADLERRYEFTDLQSFLDLYYANMSVLTEEEDFFLLAGRYLERASAAGVGHVELFVDPQAHRARGVSEKTVLAGTHRAIQEFASRGPTASIIACVMRDQPVDSAKRMLDAVLASEVPVIGVGLDSAEVGFPPALFAEVFDRAAGAGLHRVAHAGEEGPPEYVWQALDELGAERIDHGIRVLEDAALVDRLVRDRIPLTVCPLSNVRLRVVDSLAGLPLRRMLDAGLAVTINSDDPAYFGGYLAENLAAVTEEFGLTRDELARLAETSIAASFVDESARQRLRA